MIRCGQESLCSDCVTSKASKRFGPESSSKSVHDCRYGTSIKQHRQSADSFPEPNPSRFAGPARPTLEGSQSLGFPHRQGISPNRQIAMRLGSHHAQQIPQRQSVAQSLGSHDVQQRQQFQAVAQSLESHDVQQGPQAQDVAQSVGSHNVQQGPQAQGVAQSLGAHDVQQRSQMQAVAQGFGPRDDQQRPQLHSVAQSLESHDVQQGPQAQGVAQSLGSQRAQPQSSSVKRDATEPGRPVAKRPVATRPVKKRAKTSSASASIINRPFQSEADTHTFEVFLSIPRLMDRTPSDLTTSDADDNKHLESKDYHTGDTKLDELLRLWTPAAVPV